MEPLWVMAADLPDNGDMDEATLQAALGRVICLWGEIEASLCGLYCFFDGKPYDRESALAFGAARIFSDRAKLLESKAREHFIRSPHQEHEGEFDAVMLRTREFANLRNDIAHTVMRPWNWVSQALAEGEAGWISLGWCLLPMYFDPRRFTNARPNFVLNSARLNDLGSAIHRLGQNIVLYRTDWWRPDGALLPKRFEPNP